MTPKPPTTTDLYKKLDSMEATITPLVNDVASLKEWRRLEIATRKATKEAIEEYKRDERQEKPVAGANLNLKVILALVSCILALAGAVALISRGIGK